MGSSTENLPRLWWSSPAKLKLSAIKDLTILRQLVKKFYDSSIGIIVFWNHKAPAFYLYDITSKRSPMYGEDSNSKVEKAEFTIKKSMIDSMSNENVSVHEQL